MPTTFPRFAASVPVSEITLLIEDTSFTNNIFSVLQKPNCLLAFSLKIALLRSNYFVLTQEPWQLSPTRPY